MTVYFTEPNYWYYTTRRPYGRKPQAQSILGGFPWIIASQDNRKPGELSQLIHKIHWKTDLRQKYEESMIYIGGCIIAEVQQEFKPLLIEHGAILVSHVELWRKCSFNPLEPFGGKTWNNSKNI